MLGAPASRTQYSLTAPTKTSKMTSGINTSPKQFKQKLNKTLPLHYNHTHTVKRVVSHKKWHQYIPSNVADISGKRGCLFQKGTASDCWSA